tara:strand:- start:310 stop:456 length:147 start_codon:yes stop_codon:yes gene_type:complete
MRKITVLVRVCFVAAGLALVDHYDLAGLSGAIKNLPHLKINQIKLENK